MIFEQNGNYYVCDNFGNSYFGINKKICFVIKTKEEAEKKLDELKLNEAFFLMSGIDDKNAMIKFAKQEYLKDNQGKSFEEYYQSNIYYLRTIAQRSINVTSSEKVSINNIEYSVISNNSQINLSRNFKKFKYYNYENILKIMKKILLLHSKKQGGLDFSNMLWSNELASTITKILFKELTPNLTEEQLRALKKYTGNSFGCVNDFLYGSPIITDNYQEFIDNLLKIYSCSIETPYDLYLHRGATNDTDICRYGLDFTNPQKKLNMNSATYTYNQLISTSFNVTGIENFKSYEELFLKVPKGSRVIFKGMLDSRESKENEVIVMPSIFECIAENHNLKNKYLLSFSEHKDYFELIINNLNKNKDYYISQLGEENYNILYTHTLNSIANYKQQEIKKYLNKEKSNENINKIFEFINACKYYNVIQETEDFFSKHR